MRTRDAFKRPLRRRSSHYSLICPILTAETVAVERKGASVVDVQIKFEVHNVVAARLPPALHSRARSRVLSPVFLDS